MGIKLKKEATGRFQNIVNRESLQRANPAYKTPLEKPRKSPSSENNHKIMENRK